MKKMSILELFLNAMAATYKKFYIKLKKSKVFPDKLE
jgi:hypothetical protein